MENKNIKIQLRKQRIKQNKNRWFQNLHSQIF